MNSIKTASVCGLGKLGACIAATLAARGFEVVGVDIDQEKIKKIDEGLAPLDEPLLAETILAGGLRRRRESTRGQNAYQSGVSVVVTCSLSNPAAAGKGIAETPRSPAICGA